MKTLRKESNNHLPENISGLQHRHMIDHLDDIKISRRIIKLLNSDNSETRSLFPSLDLPSHSELPANDIKTLARQNKILDYFYPRVSPESDTHKQIHNCLVETCKTLEIDAKQFNIVIYKSSEANASVHHVTRNVRISTGLLELFSYNSVLVQAIIAHEMGHVLLKHYKETNTLFAVKNEYNKLDDFLGKHTLKFEEEYQADRIACISLALGGVSPKRKIEALTLLEKLEQETKHNNNNYENDNDSLPQLLNTHPATQRRIKALKHLVRNLPIVKKSENLINTISVPETYVTTTKPPVFSWQFYDRDLINNSYTNSIIDPVFDEEEIHKRDYDSASHILKLIQEDLEYMELSQKDINKFLKITKNHLNETDYANLQKKYIVNHKKNLFHIELGEEDIPQNILRAILAGLDDLGLINSETVDHKVDFLDCSPDETNSFFDENEDDEKIKLDLTTWWTKTKLSKCDTNSTNKSLSREELTQNFVCSWWGQAMNDAFNHIAFDDLQADIEGYSLSTVRNLLRRFEMSEYIPLAKAFAKSSYQYGDVHIGPQHAFVISSLLVKQWLTQCPNGISQIDHIRNLLEELEQYWDTHGYPFPVNHYRIAKILGNLHKSGDENQKQAVEKLISDYYLQFDIITHVSNVESHIEHILKPLRKTSLKENKEVLDENTIEKEICHAYEVTDKTNVAIVESEMTCKNEKSETKINFELELTLLSRGTEALIIQKSPYTVQLSIPPHFSDEEARASIEKACQAFNIPYRSSCNALTIDTNSVNSFIAEAHEVFVDLRENAIITSQAAQEFFEQRVIPYFHDYSTARARALNLYKDDELRQSIREKDLIVQINTLGTTEFERLYLSNFGREDFEETDYLEIDRGVPHRHELNRMWTLAYQSEFQRHLTSEDKSEAIFFIGRTFPTACAHRDQWYSKVLSLDGESLLTTISDITALQEHIEQITDIRVLLELSQAFYNKLLRVSASNRLYEIFQEKGHDKFLSEIPNEIIEKRTTILSTAFEDNSSKMFQIALALIICYPDASYRRDEFLTKLVDKAKTWKEKQTISGLFTEPPYGVIGSRTANDVIVHESLYDAFQKLDDIERAEVLLYVLGKRNFISGIDSAFMTSLGRKKVSEMRWSYLLDPAEKPFISDHYVDEDEDDDEDDFLYDDFDDDYDKRIDIENFEIKSFNTPDAIVHLQKKTGIPISLLFQQHNIAVSHREQLEAMEEVLFGIKGILHTKHKTFLIHQIAHLLVQQGTFSHNPSQNNAIESLITVVLLNCSSDKLPSIMLDVWYLAFNKEEISLPTLVAKMMQKAGPVFVVAAQYLAHQTAALPTEWIQAFRVCVDENTTFDSTLIDTHISAYLGGNPFADINEKKGEGSKAFVNRVTGFDGSDYVTKIFHSFIEEELPGDIALLEKIVKHINRNKKLFSVNLPSNLSKVVEAKMRKQIDPATEIAGHSSLRSVLKSKLGEVSFATVNHIPKYSKGLVLTYENIEGVPLDKTKDLDELGISLEKQQLMRNMTGLEILRQIIQTGTFQSDPNLGNFLVGKDDKVVYWIDYGSIEQIKESERLLLLKLLRTFIVRKTPMFSSLIPEANENEPAELLAQMLTEDTQIDNATENIQEWINKELNNNSNLENMGNILSRFQDFCSEQGYVLKDHWISILTTLGLIKPLLHDCPKNSFIEVLSPVILGKG